MIILIRYTRHNFSHQYLVTVGMEYVQKDVEIENKKIRVKIWDTAGQEQYKAITSNFFRNSDGIIIVYDTTNRDSFEKVGDWMKTIDQYVSNEEPVPFILVGNKIDLDKERAVSTDEGKQLADSKNIPFFEASAKENIGVDEFMNRIITDVVNGVTHNKKGVDLEEMRQDVEKSKKCC